MCADGADFGSGSANVDVAAVEALPDANAVTDENLALVDVGKQLAVALFVFLFDLRYAVKQVGEVVETLFAGFLGEGGVHVGPLVVFAGSGVIKVGGGVGDFAAVERLEPKLGVLLFVAGSLFKDRRDLIVAFLLRSGGIVGILDRSLGFACKCSLQIRFGLGAFEFLHGVSPFQNTGCEDKRQESPLLLVILIFWALSRGKSTNGTNRALWRHLSTGMGRDIISKENFAALPLKEV